MRREWKYEYHTHWCESCAAASTPRHAMTEYYRKLDAVVQSRYLGKLKFLGLEEKVDPYEASNSYNFIDDTLVPVLYRITPVHSIRSFTTLAPVLYCITPVHSIRSFTTLAPVLYCITPVHSIHSSTTLALVLYRITPVHSIHSFTTLA